ncbi:PD-(D/E)XK nuclease family protein [Miniphocaeibacter massiliensis]|uniref:PD-(D/E)XK nuclease family protein n=1 Tax=Miniphocaeibacter massiliensis TaxID=2041841 RepID=UPI000C08B963|nr:PD-(D/E)XK nuclease family protein [Miniphocaeibacter massiliensis]
MQKVYVYNSARNIYNDFKELIINKLKDNNNKFIAILPNGNLIDRLRKDITNEFEVIFDLKLFTFDDLINYKNISFSEVENFDYYNKLIISYSINNCISKGFIENSSFYNSDGFLSLASKMINYIKSSLLSSDNFLREVERDSSLFSIAKIYEEYSKNLKKYNFEDRYDKYFKFIDSKFSFDIENEIEEVFIFGFLDFRKIEYEILKVLRDLKIKIKAFYYNSLNENIDIFKETKEKLEKIGFEYTYIKDKVQGKCRNFKLVECEDKYLEVKRLSIELKKDLLEGHSKKIGIIVNDEEYIEIVKDRFIFENIQLNSNSKAYLKESDFGKWMLNLLDYEIGLKKYIIRNLKNPMIFEKPINDIELEKLILSISITSKEDLFNSTILKSNSNYNEYIEILNSIFNIIELQKDKENIILFIKEKLKKYFEVDDSKLILYEKFYNFIDGLNFRLSSITNSLKSGELIRHLKEILNEFSINENSMVDYNVYLVEFNNFKALEFDNIYFLGMTEENYPKKETDNFYFNNKNIYRLKDLGIDILDRKLKNSKNELNFFNIINSNYFKIYISYENSNKSIISDYVLGIVDIKEKEQYKFKNFINPKVENVINEKDKRLYFSSFQKVYEDIRREITYKISFSNNILNNKFSATSLETYYLCPIKYYYKYVIELKDNLIKTKLEESALLGTACHETLRKLYEYYFEEIKENNNTEDIVYRILKTELKELDFNIDDFKGSNILKRYTNLLVSLIKMDLIYINNSKKDLTPYKFEEKFEIKKQLNINGDTKNIIISGRVDRIDRDGNNNFYLIDYKLGKNSFKTLADFQKGRTLQFPIYSLIKNIDGCRYITIKDFKNHEFFNLSNEYNGKGYLNREEFDELRYKTVLILEDIITQINNENYFKGTEEKTNCTFCEYSNICDYRSN